MNLFTISNNTKEIAQSLDDVLLAKTIVESAQMLSTAILLNDEIKEKPEGLYKVYNANEEHNVWVRTNSSNFKWTMFYLLDCIDEYNYRFGKLHGSYDIAKKVGLYENYFKSGEMTTFPRKFNKDYENYNDLMNMDDVYKAYRTYLNYKWHLKNKSGVAPIWTKRLQPEFFK